MDVDKFLTLDNVVDTPELLFRSSTPKVVVDRLLGELTEFYATLPAGGVRAEYHRFVEGAFSATLKEGLPSPRKKDLDDLATGVFGLHSVQWSEIMQIRNKVYPYRGRTVAISTLCRIYGKVAVLAAIKAGRLPITLQHKGDGRGISEVTGERLASAVLGAPPTVQQRRAQKQESKQPKQMVQQPTNPPTNPPTKHRTPTVTPVTEVEVTPVKPTSQSSSTIRVKTMTLRGGNLTVPPSVVLVIDHLVVEGSHSILLG